MKSWKVKEVLAGTYEFGVISQAEYSKEAFQELEKSYNNAKQVFENVGSTGEQIVQTYNELKTANVTFVQSKVVEQPKKHRKEKLQINIESAKVVVKSARCKCNGRFSESTESKITVAEAE